MQRDIDHIIERLRAELPGAHVTQLQVTHPGADDDGVWFIKFPGGDGEVQIESSDGNCPFLIESDLSDDRLYRRSIDEVVRTVRGLYARQILKREFDAEKGSFLLQARCHLEWDWDAFRRLTGAMYDVADEVKGQPSIETWIAEGFWFCDTWIPGHTSHPKFPRPPEEAHRDALRLLDELASFLFTGQSPYEDDTLRKRAKG
jgi:hypothetical protein